MPRKLVGALIAATFLVGSAAGTLSVVSAASLAHMHAEHNDGKLLELEFLL